MAAIWASIDAGKTHHHCVAIDESGHRMLSRRVANDELELLELLADVLALRDDVTVGSHFRCHAPTLATRVPGDHRQHARPSGSWRAPPDGHVDELIGMRRGARSSPAQAACFGQQHARKPLRPRWHAGRAAAGSPIRSIGEWSPFRPPRPDGRVGRGSVGLPCCLCERVTLFWAQVCVGGGRRGGRSPGGAGAGCGG